MVKTSSLRGAALTGMFVALCSLPVLGQNGGGVIGITPTGVGAPTCQQQKASLQFFAGLMASAAVSSQAAATKSEASAAKERAQVGQFQDALAAAQGELDSCLAATVNSNSMRCGQYRSQIAQLLGEISSATKAAVADDQSAAKAAALVISDQRGSAAFTAEAAALSCD